MTERRLGSGEPFRVSSREHSNWQDAGRFAREHSDDALFNPDGNDSQDDVILVKNTTGRFLPRYSVVGLRGTLRSPRYSPQALVQFKNNMMLIGEDPSSTTTGRFAVLQLPAKDNEWVPGKISSTTPVRLLINSITDQFADVETSSSVADKTRYLKSASTGSAQIIYQPEIVGEQWGYVRLGNKLSGSTASATTNGLNNGTWTAASGTDQFSGVNSLSPPDGAATFELDGDGYVVFNRNPAPCFVSSVLLVSVPFVQNQYCGFECSLQTKPVGGAWADVGFGGFQTTAWPNVATLSGSGAADNYTLPMRTGYSFSVGTKMRFRMRPTFSGSSPGTIQVTGQINFFYQT